MRNLDKHIGMSELRLDSVHTPAQTAVERGTAVEAIDDYTTQKLTLISDLRDQEEHWTAMTRSLTRKTIGLTEKYLLPRTSFDTLQTAELDELDRDLASLVHQAHVLASGVRDYAELKNHRLCFLRTSWEHAQALRDEST